MILAGRRGAAACARCSSSPPRCPSRTRASARPTSEEAADQKHARFADEHSDFIAYLNLWRYLARAAHGAVRQPVPPDVPRASSCTTCGSASGRTCTASCAGSPGGSASRRATTEPADPARVHAAAAGRAARRTSACASGDSREYLGARNARFVLAPGLGAQQEAAALGDGGRAGRDQSGCGRGSPRGSSRSGSSRSPAHLVKRTYSEPHWDARRGRGDGLRAGDALRRAARRRAARSATARIDPEVSRELFIRHALVEGDWETRHHFFHDNRRLLEEVEELEDRARRRDILVDDEALFEFYDGRIPADVVSGRHFDSWWRKARHENPTCSRFDARRCCINETAPDVSAATIPTSGARRTRPAPHLPVRAGHRGRRGDGRTSRCTS